MNSTARVAAVCLLALCVALPSSARESRKQQARAQVKKPLEFSDLMKFRAIRQPALSDDGGWLAYELRPDRGDGAVEVVSADGKTRYTLERGRSAAVSSQGRFVVATRVPSFEAQETAEGDKPKPGLVLLDTRSGEEIEWQDVDRADFSKDGRWLAILHAEAPEEDPDSEEGEEAEEAGESEEQAQAEETGESEEAGESQESQAEEAEEGEETEEGEEAEETDDTKAEDDSKLETGTTLRLRDLETGEEVLLEHVLAYSFDDTATWLAYSVAAPEGENGLFLRQLGAENDAATRAVTAAERGHYTQLSWAEDQPLLAFIASAWDEDGEPGDGAVWIWQGESGEGRAVSTSENLDEGWHVPAFAELTWSRDGERLFYGTRPRPAPKADEEDDDAPFDPYDFEALLAETGVDVWHTGDPLIKTNERKQWEAVEKERSYLAVYHLSPSAPEANVQLATLEVRDVVPSESARSALGFADVPYLRLRTFEGFFADAYTVDLRTGERTLFAEKMPSAPNSTLLSPDGRFAAYYRSPHWHLYDVEAGTHRSLTGDLDVSFADEDHDYPSPAGMHGTAGWLADSSALLLYDRYDIWHVPAEPGAGGPTALTGGAGREQRLELRVIREDRDEPFLDPAARLLLSGYSETLKTSGFWQLASPVPGEERPEALEAAQGERFHRFIRRSEDGGRLLFTRESYREFPDLWLADSDFESPPRRLTDANPQTDDFAWGEAELVRFTDSDGRPSDAVLIRPEGMGQDDRCPVLVYYYRFFSQRLHRFNEPVVNHRPSFPLYASHGYCVFLPDVRFEVGRPGFSATKALVPAVQKIVDMGVADPEALGLHGHSWSGYQTAHVVTQTHAFAAAVTGAPVSNMTSAYGGIRYGTGLARQFQYETGQSRIGKSLWEDRASYIENSPLFYADRIETPLLIQFGDQDEAVPWTQGVELYLA
ncbi:MAG: prolyl oligopeptidase family serine peptidase, partial [Acidobacteriota bacterium]